MLKNSNRIVHNYIYGSRYVQHSPISLVILDVMQIMYTAITFCILHFEENWSNYKFLRISHSKQRLIVQQADDESRRKD